MSILGDMGINAGAFLARDRFALIPLDSTGLVLLAALAPGIAAYWIYGWAQKILGASRVAVTLYLSPLYAALASWAVLGEPLDWHHLGGAALILPGVFLATYKRPV